MLDKLSGSVVPLVPAMGGDMPLYEASITLTKTWDIVLLIRASSREIAGRKACERGKALILDTQLPVGEYTIDDSETEVTVNELEAEK
jgi:hypothetical protein